VKFGQKRTVRIIYSEVYFALFEKNKGELAILNFEVELKINREGIRFYYNFLHDR
jgi:hypothetical protein